MSTENIEKFKSELNLVKDRIKHLERELEKLGPGVQKQDTVTPSEGGTDSGEAIEQTEKLTPDVLTIDGVVNLINIRNFKRLENFKLLAMIVFALKRETSKYGKTRPQKIIIADEKNQRFQLLNWHKSMDQKLLHGKDHWVILDSVYLKENDRRFPDNRFLEFEIAGELRQYNIHSSKNFKVINYNKVS